MAKRASGEGSIFKLKDGTWRAAIPGGRHSFRGKTRAEAIRRRDAYLRSHRIILSLPKSARDSFAALLSRWLDSRRDSLRPRTFESYHETSTRYIIPTIGEIPIGQLSPEDIQRAMAAGKSPRTKNYIRSVCHLALEYAVDNDMIARNPARKARRVAPPERHLEMPSADESTSLIAAIQTENPCPRALLFVILFSGLRVGEACGARWSDYTNDYLHVRRALDREGNLVPVKTAAGRRTVPIQKLARAALEEWRAEQSRQKEEHATRWRDATPDLMFTTRFGTAWSQRNVLRVAHRVTKKAGIGRRSVHYLRHLAISYLISDPEVDIKTVQSIAGHSSIRVTLDTYGHLMPGQLQKAARAMDRRG